jgi:hypothetical protein
MEPSPALARKLPLVLTDIRCHPYPDSDGL